MTDSRETYRTLDLALRVGEILLSSGAGAADVSATMRALAEHGGLRKTDIDVTFTSLRMSHQADPEEMPVLLTRQVTERTIDYDELTRVQDLVRWVLTDQVLVQDARAAVARLSSTDPWVPRWATYVGSAVLGGGIALLLGAGWAITLVAALAGFAVTWLQNRLAAQAWPMFYRQAAGGFLGSSIAVVATALPLQGVNPSLVVTSSIVLLLSGIGFMGAVQDALSGFYITASARILEAVLATSGLIAGVAGGLATAPLYGLATSAVNPARVQTPANLEIAIVGAIVAAGAFAIISYAPLRSLPAIGLATLVGQAVSIGFTNPTTSLPWASALAAVAIGAVSHAIAGRVHVPPLVVVVPALVPLLPGLQIYRGLTFISDGNVRGLLQITGAGATTIALAAGVILGEYMAQPMKRNARTLEQRLLGPRLVGVLHAHRGWDSGSEATAPPPPATMTVSLHAIQEAEAAAEAADAAAGAPDAAPDRAWDPDDTRTRVNPVVSARGTRAHRPD